MAVGLPEGPSYPEHSLTQPIFSPFCPVSDRRRTARSFFEIDRLSSLYYCLFLARLLILLLLLIGANVHPNPYLVFSCLMCAGNVTWRGRSVQCRTCFKWVHLKCSLLFFSRFRTLGSTNSWSFPSSCVPASSRNPTCNSTATFSSDYSSLYTSTAQSGPPSANAALPPYPRFQTYYPFFVHFVSSPYAPSPPLHAPGCFSTPPASSSLPDFFRSLQWNGGGLRTISTELLPCSALPPPGENIGMCVQSMHPITPGNPLMVLNSC